MSLTVASGAVAGSLFATGDGVTTAGAGVAAGFAAGREFAGRRGVCATTTTNNKTATRVARVSLVKFIRASFCFQRGPRRPRLYWRTIIFEEARFGKRSVVSKACSGLRLRQRPRIQHQLTRNAFFSQILLGFPASSGPRVSAPLPAYQFHQQFCRAAAAQSAGSATRNRSCGDWMAEPGQKLLR